MERRHRKIARKEWTDFFELEQLLERLDMSDIDFQMIAGCASSSFYLWKKKGKVPANMLSKLKEELAKYFKSEYDKKCEILWGKE